LIGGEIGNAKEHLRLVIEQCDHAIVWGQQSFLAAFGATFVVGHVFLLTEIAFEAKTRIADCQIRLHHRRTGLSSIPALKRARKSLLLFFARLPLSISYNLWARES